MRSAPQSLSHGQTIPAQGLIEAISSPGRFLVFRGSDEATSTNQRF